MTKASRPSKKLARAASPPVAATPKPSSGLLALPTGHEIYYADSGGTGPVLFYLYGLGCSIAHWKYQLAYFGSKDRGARPPLRRGARVNTPPYRQVWFDFRGHGRSSPLPPGEQLTMSAIVEDVVAVAKHLGIRSATFLGQSMGGSLVLQLARDYPDLVESLVLLASPTRSPSRTMPLQPVSGWLWHALVQVQKHAPFAVNYVNRLNALLLEHPLLRVPFREFIRANGFNPYLAQTSDIDEYIVAMLAIDARLFTALMAELTHFDAVRFAKRITCPVLMISGAHDLVVPPSESRRLLKHLGNGQLAVIPHGSHCPHFDDAALVNQILAEFLAAPGGLQKAAANER